MNLRNRFGLYGSYFFGMAGIGFTLPYLPAYLKETKGYSDQDIALVFVLSAVAGLVQFPLGLWSDKLGRRKPFLVAALAVLAGATLVLPWAGGLLLGVAVVLFAENGACRATVESLAGAEAAHLAEPGQVGRAIGALRFWRPVSIVLTALLGGVLAKQFGVAWLLGPVAVLQGLAVVAALAITDDRGGKHPDPTPSADAEPADGPKSLGLKDAKLWVFIAAMVLFHVGNAPGGMYLGLYLQGDLAAPKDYMSFAFVVSMVAWMGAVRPAGRLADALGRKPVLIAAWTIMTVRLVLIAVAQAGWQILLIQPLDGLGQGLFAVTAAAWVTDRLADPKRVGEAQVLVGCALVGGSALGPALAGLVVGDLGYRGTFWVLAGVGAVATLIVTFLVPETKTADAPAVTAEEKV
ncbi:MFS transporter [Limnoglobus roseus]|uniref:MFS transporter n=1 Tax=Limnoglobus roseus TaxID=2598579 RepID=A0A5C1AH60_9BACT|nr:MFS transporter [Limnoglobus roseus]QEL17497.1 MFS transporter [Limnoglobus roseus]